MNLLARIRRRTLPETPMTADTTPTTPTTDAVIMRFLALGGATVELHTTTYTSSHDTQPHTHKGFNWRCLGCDLRGHQDIYGRPTGIYEETTPSEARADANTHATACRSMPKPEATQ